MSLKQRLLFLVLSAVLCIWVGAAALTYYDAQHELNELLDAHLAQTSTFLVAKAAHELEDEEGHTPLLHKYSRHLAFQVWEDGEELKLHSSNAPNVPLSTVKEGFSDSVVQGTQWRVFSSWDAERELLIQVAESAQMRNNLAREITSRLLLPLLLALPLLAGLVWWMVGTSLRPLVKLTQAVASRQPNNLTPLAIAVPREVQPLIERLNRLFARISALIENERRFTADAAHELRTPMAGIKAQLQVAQAEMDETQRKRALDNAVQGCNRATHLISQLLTLARLDSSANTNLQLCDLQHLSAEVVAQMAPSALATGIHLELVEGEPLSVMGLPLLLQVLLRNLLENAQRYTPSGTTVQVSIYRQGSHIGWQVEDNGPGLPAEELSKITQRFYRALGNSASGSGLGLSIVQRIAEIHQATLSLSNVKPHGLCVCILFPGIPETIK